ncbi:two-component system regulatory protein YycI [Alteribacillus bidgolensis]|uniref:Two-component signal transduction system YycFG, regulatory protein YycI n=1 Tax=Alteribacillus bidgolensis TaxID=930129 RepID=A0A1G8LSK6_9BACI|nr:two-component system regulatory protein YycI [Alteribacillus bidgolensis]SDI58674.1 Two-component signal transduction system YycFG, regulatory protein YycI [Alteribacillus bidgolensis]
MDWNRTKTIFIITFLLLNAFLLYQLLEKKNASEIDVRAQATVRERLADMNIHITEELPEERSEINHIVGQPVQMEEEVINKVGEDNVNILNNRFVEVTLEEPYEVTSDVEESISNFLDQNVWNADEYRYESWNSNDRQMYFNQTYEEKTVVTYEEDQLVLFFNEDNEIESYVQSYLNFEEEGKEKDMLDPYKAIEVLLNDGIISFNDQVNKVELGYHSLFSPEGEVQVFAPMYQIEINEDKNYLVHAIDGSIQELAGNSDNSQNDGNETDSGESEGD